jgi:hypothetical protein
MQSRRDSACCEPACHEPLSGTSVSEIADKGFRAGARTPCRSAARRARAVRVASRRSFLTGSAGLGESVPQQSVRRVTQDLLNRLAAGACYGLVQYSRFSARNAPKGRSCRQATAATAMNSCPTTWRPPSAARAGAVGNAGLTVPLPGAAAGGRWRKPLCRMVEKVLVDTGWPDPLRLE